MACLVNKPHLYRDTTTGIMVKRFGVGLSIGYLSPFYFCVLCRSVLLMARRLQPLINQMMSVDRRDGGIAVAVEHDQRDDPAQASRIPTSPSPHRRKAGGQIRGNTISKARMHTDSSIEVWIRRSHDDRHSSTGRHPGHIDSVDINMVCMDDLLRDASNKRWLTAAAQLISGLKPVPTPGVVGRRGLLGIRHEERLLFGQSIHARASSKINRVLSTAMQHNHQGNCLSCSVPGDVEFVGTHSSRIAIGSIDEAPTWMG